MKSQYLQNPPRVFRTKTSYFYIAVAAIIVIAGCVGFVMQDGALALVTHCWPLYFLFYTVWYLLMKPHLVVDREKLTVVNPFRIHTVGYAALIDVSTKFNLTLVTPSGKYQAFAIPATGMAASLKRTQGDTANMPSMTGVGTGVIKASDLPHGFAGGVAQVVRGYWQELVEAEALDSVSNEEATELDVPGLCCFILLALATIVTFVWVY